MRMIDADKVLLSIIKTQQEYEGMSRLVEDTDPYFLGAIVGLKEAAFEILNAIEVDAVPIVRCKDCKYYDEDTLWCDMNMRDECQSYNWYPTDFCSYGERRDDDG